MIIRHAEVAPRFIPNAIARPVTRSWPASIELIEVKSEKRLAARTKDLSLFGCYVEAVTPFPEGTKVRLRISHGGTSLPNEVACADATGADRR